MEMILATTLILGFVFLFLFIIPRFTNPSQSKGDANSSKNISKGARRYAKAEVSLHNKRTDCWIIIKDKVYDVTPYVEEHPGGDAILTHAGDDSTEGFYGPQHGTRVFDIIDDFCIGDLDQ